LRAALETGGRAAPGIAGWTARKALAALAIAAPTSVTAFAAALRPTIGGLGHDA
jgi:hypothetical protein